MNRHLLHAFKILLSILIIISFIFPTSCTNAAVGNPDSTSTFSTSPTSPNLSSPSNTTGWASFSSKGGFLPDDNVTSIAQDKQGNLWFGTDRGASMYDGTSWHIFTNQNGLSGNQVKAIFCDDDDNVWFATENGVSRFNPIGSKWLSNYVNRKKMKITGSIDGVQTNYQMKLTVHKGNGTDYGADVYLGNKVKDDFSDVRFTKSDGSTLLDYWLESCNPGISAVIWVEVDLIPAPPAAASYYIYYSNASAKSASNGEVTFPFFDDFNNESIDDNKWNIFQGTPVEESGNLTCYGRSPNYDVILGKVPFGYGYGVHARVYFTGGGNCQIGMCATHEMQWYANIPLNGNIFMFIHGGTGGETWPSVGTYDTNWHYPIINRYSSTLLRLYDGTSLLSTETATARIPNGNDLVVRTLTVAPNSTTVTDWVFVSKCTANEPIFSSWGIEEAIATTFVTNK